jgi:hypothetical protein
MKTKKQLESVASVSELQTFDRDLLETVIGGTDVNHNDAGAQDAHGFRSGLDDMAARAQASNHALMNGDFGGFFSNTGAEIADGWHMVTPVLSSVKDVFGER